MSTTSTEVEPSPHLQGFIPQIHAGSNTIVESLFGLRQCRLSSKAYGTGVIIHKIDTVEMALGLVYHEHLARGRSISNFLRCVGALLKRKRFARLCISHNVKS